MQLKQIILLEHEAQLVVQDRQIEEVNQFKNITKSAVTKMETRMITFDNRLKELEDDARHRNHELKKTSEDVSSHNERLLKLDFKLNNFA